MSARTDDETEFHTVGADASDIEQYAEVTLEEGGVIIYDQTDETRWIQADAAVALESIA